ncbi:MAG: amino acid adenylation domain-containing protein [Cyanobacteria bacterium P01_A01_bin.80]
MEDITQRIANFSPAKRALLEQQLKQKSLKTKLENNIAPRINFQDSPLSFSQQHMWLVDQLEPGNPAYNRPTNISLTGTLNVAALEKSLNEIIRRHEILRTSFKEVNGQLFQKINSSISLKLPIVDLTNLHDNQEIEVQHLATKEAQQTFDLTQTPLLKAILVRLDEQKHILLLIMHHIIFDGWSMGVLLKELAVLYEAFSTGKPSPLPELPIQYADYAVWQRKWLTGKVLDEQLNYWKQQLAGANPRLELPTDSPRPPVQTYNGASTTLTLPQILIDALQQLCRQEGVTLYMTLLAAFGTLLHRYTGQEDILIGSPVAGRNRAEIEELIGFFINTVVLRANFSKQHSFRSLLAQVREVTLGAYDHQGMPFEKLVEELQLERDSSRNPLFQVWFNMLNLKDIQLKFPGLDVESISTGEAASKFDLTLYMAEQEDGLKLKLVYNTDLFAPQRMVEMLNQYQYLLSQIVENPEIGISNLSMVTPKAKSFLPNPEQQLPCRWEGAIPSKFSQQAQRVPQHLAVVDAQVAWTYDQLEEYTNQLANYLLENHIHQQDVVAIYSQRSVSLVWAILGVLKAGAAFVILDPAYPTSRLIDCLELVQPRAWLQVASEEIPTDLQTYVDSLACDGHLDVPQGSALAIPDLLQDYSTDIPDVTTEPDNLAYIAFTSGSTGKPKGIKGTHRPLSHFVQWHCQTFELNQSDRFSMLSGLSHDPLLRDIFTPLSLGATLYIPKQEDIYSPHKLAEWIEQQQISIAHLTPAMGQMLSADIVTTTKYLRYLFFGGDVLTVREVESIGNFAPNAKSVNFYGSTETPQAMGYFIIPQNHLWSKDTVPLGKGIDDVQLLLLNFKQQLAGIGELAEIYVRTPYLTKGYIGSKELNDQRFIVNPLTKISEDKLYKTGDLARYLPDGNIEFLGRIDNQVKIRGFRIELGEIESILHIHPQIQQAIVIVQEDIPDNKRLVAYIVTDKSISTNELRKFIKKKLPEYMVPSTFVALDNLPLTPNGKVDKKALLKLDASNIQVENKFVPPSNSTEEILAAIWADILGVEQVGIHDNFFDLGGHSLLAMRLVAQIEKVTEKKLPLAALFKFTTISELASLIQNKVADINPNLSTDLPSIDADKLRALLTIMAGREGARPRPDSLMVAFRETGKKPPLFFCANATWEIRPLTQHLGEEQPIYLLESGYAIFDQKGQLNKAPADDIKAIASRHLRDILLVSPEGPYFLVGYSFGKLVAYEVAKQLQKSGKEVAFLAILDSPGSGKTYQYAKKILVGITEMSEELLSGSLLSFTKRFGLSVWKVKEDLTEMGRKTTGKFLRKNTVSSKSTINQSSIDCTTVSEKQQNNSEIKKSTSYLEQSKAKYLMEGYQGKITLFVTSLVHRNHNKILRRLFPLMGWNKHVIEIIKIPGDHNSMVREPDVQAFAESLIKILANRN